MKTFSLFFVWRGIQLHWNPGLCLWSNKAQNSVCFAPGRILYQIVVTFQKTTSFEDIAHFIDEENIVTYVDFDCCNTFYPKAASKIWHINRERKNICRSYKKPIRIPIDDLNSCSIVEERTSKIILSLYNFWDRDPADPVFFSDKNYGVSLSNQYP